MAIDVLKEKLLTLHRVCELLPGNKDEALVYETVLGWTRKGRTPRLDSVKVGGKRYTSERALREFVDASNNDGQKITECVAGKKRSSTRAKLALETLETQFQV